MSRDQKSVPMFTGQPGAHFPWVKEKETRLRAEERSWFATCHVRKHDLWGPYVQKDQQAWFCCKLDADCEQLSLLNIET